MQSKIKNDDELLRRLEKRYPQLGSSHEALRRETDYNTFTWSERTLTYSEICLTLTRFLDSTICLWDKGELHSWPDVDVVVRRFYEAT